MKYTAVIPVKKNSSRLPGKNLLKLNGETLLERKIRQLQLSRTVDEILVSSDSEEMLAVAEAKGVKCDRRPDHFADESRPLSEFFDYISDIITPGHMVWSCVTSPFFDEKLMIDAKACYQSAVGDGFDSLITTYNFKHYLFDAKGPLNFQRGEAHQNSQELNSIDLFTNGWLIAPVDKVREWRYNYGPNPYRFYVDQISSLDIDTPADFEIAKAFLRLKN